MARDGEKRRPRLAILFGPLVLVLQVVEAGAGAREIIWLVDRTITKVDDSMRLLKRLGRVVDITGLDPQQAAEQVAPHEPDGILAFAEAQLMRAAQIGAELGLPVQSVETVTRLTNKVAQREALRAAGLPIPAFWQVPADADEALHAEICAAAAFPVVVKPSAGVGSRGTYRVDDAAELARMLELERQEQTGDLIVEQMLRDGWPREREPYADFVSVESIVAHGRLSHLAVTGRSTLAEPYRETGHFIPSNVSSDVRAEVVELAGRAVRAMGSDIGIFHTEIKITPDGLFVIEVNGRIGGSIPEIFGLATDQQFSILDVACRVALGEPVRIDELVPCSRVGYSLWQPPPVEATRLARLDNMAEVRRIPGVHAMFVNKQAGDPLSWKAGWSSRLFTVYGAADDHAGMWAARRRVKDTVIAEFD